MNSRNSIPGGEQRRPSSAVPRLSSRLQRYRQPLRVSIPNSFDPPIADFTAEEKRSIVSKILKVDPNQAPSSSLKGQQFEVEGVNLQKFPRRDAPVSAFITPAQLLAVTKRGTVSAETIGIGTGVAVAAAVTRAPVSSTTASPTAAENVSKRSTAGRPQTAPGRTSTVEKGDDGNSDDDFHPTFVDKHHRKSVTSQQPATRPATAKLPMTTAVSSDGTDEFDRTLSAFAEDLPSNSNPFLADSFQRVSAEADAENISLLVLQQKQDQRQHQADLLRRKRKKQQTHSDGQEEKHDEHQTFLTMLPNELKRTYMEQMNDTNSDYDEDEGAHGGVVRDARSLLEIKKILKAKEMAGRGPTGRPRKTIDAEERRAVVERLQLLPAWKQKLIPKKGPKKNFFKRLEHSLSVSEIRRDNDNELDHSFAGSEQQQPRRDSHSPLPHSVDYCGFAHSVPGVVLLSDIITHGVPQTEATIEGHQAMTSQQLRQAVDAAGEKGSHHGLAQQKQGGSAPNSKPPSRPSSAARKRIGSCIFQDQSVDQSGISNLTLAQMLSKASPYLKEHPLLLAVLDRDHEDYDEAVSVSLQTVSSLPSTFSKLDYLRKHPLERRAFIDAIDASFAQRRRVQLLEKREKEMERAKEEAEIALSFVAAETPGERSGKGGGLTKQLEDARLLQANEQYFRAALRNNIALEREKHLRDAKERREGLQSWRTARAIDELQKPEFNRVRRFKEAQLELQENAWITFITHALALFEWHDKFISFLQRTQQNEKVARFTAPGVVLHVDAGHRERLRLVRATRLIWRFWLKMKTHFMTTKKRRALNMIFQFFRDIGDSIRIPIAIRKKLKYVRKVQHIFRSKKPCRVARREMCLLQLKKYLKDAVKEDEQELQRLREMQQSHEKDLAQRRGMHRLAKQESITKMANMVKKREEFFTQRRESMAFFTDIMIKKGIHPILTEREKQFTVSLVRYGVALKYYILTTEGSLSQKPRSKNKKRTSPTQVSSATEDPESPVGFDLTDSKSRAQFTQELEQNATTASKGPVRPLRPHFPSLLSPEELSKVTMQCIDEVKMAKAAEEAMAGVISNF